MRELIDGKFLEDFEELFRPFDKKAMVMRTDIKENEKNYEFDIDMPGFKKEEISIDINDGYLTVKAKKEENKEKNSNEGYLRRERFYSASRSYFVGDKIKEEDIKAKYDNGVLSITVPKEEPKKLSEHKITID